MHTLRVTPCAVLLPGEAELGADGASPITDWHAAAAAALLRLGEDQAADIHIVVDDRLSIAAVISGPLAWVSADELAAAARAWFTHLLGSADLLAICAVPQPDGRHATACALPVDLVEGVGTAVASAGHRLISLRPHWAEALAVAERGDAGAPVAAGLVVAPNSPPGLHALGLFRAGTWLAIGLEPADGRPDSAAQAAQAMVRREEVLGRLTPTERPGSEGLWLTPAESEETFPAPTGWTRMTRNPAPARELTPGPYSLNRLDFVASQPAVPRAGVAVAIMGALMLLAATFQALLGENTHATLEEALAERRIRSLATAAATAPPLPMPAAELEALGASLAWPMLPILDQLAAARAPGIVLTRLEPVAEAQSTALTRASNPSAALRLRVAGQAPSAVAAANWSVALASTPGFETVRLLSLETGTVGPSVRFELEVVRHGR